MVPQSVGPWDVPLEVSHEVVVSTVPDPLPLVLTKKRKRAGKSPSSSTNKNLSHSATSSSLDSMMLTVRKAQQHGIQFCIRDLKCDKETIYSWIDQVFGKNGPFSVLTEDRFPPKLAELLITNLKPLPHYDLTDVVSSAEKLMKDHRCRARFAPSPDWAARFVLRNSILNALDDITVDRIFEKSSLPLIPKAAIVFMETGAALSLKSELSWEIRLEVVELAQKTSVRVAAKLTGIPKSTIAEWTQKTGMDGNSGRKLSYSTDIDNGIFSWVVRQVTAGIPVTTEDLQKTARERVTTEGFVASRGWAIAFCRRHRLSSAPLAAKDLTVAAAESQSKAVGSPAFSDSDYAVVKTILDELLHELYGQPIELLDLKHF